MSTKQPSLTHDEHRQRHVELHKALDELIADFLFHVRRKLPDDTTIMELMIWSHQQTIEPWEFDKDGDTVKPN